MTSFTDVRIFLCPSPGLYFCQFSLMGVIQSQWHCPIFLPEKALTHDPLLYAQYVIYSVEPALNWQLSVLSRFMQIQWTAVCIAWLNLNMKYLTLIILVSHMTAEPPLKSVGLWIKPCQTWYGWKSFGKHGAVMQLSIVFQSQRQTHIAGPILEGL